MAARYDFREIKNVNDDGKTTILYPRLVSKGTVSWERIVKEVSHDSSFDPGTVIGVMRQVEQRVLWHMSDGFRVQVGDMCYAEPTVEMVDADRHVADESQVHAQSVRFGKVKLQPQKGFRTNGRLERAELVRKFGHSSTRLTADERYERLTAYLAEHGIISRKQYSELTGLLRSNAQRELNRWIAEGKLNSCGRAPHRMYTLEKKSGDQIFL